MNHAEKDCAETGITEGGSGDRDPADTGNAPSPHAEPANERAQQPPGDPEADGDHGDHGDSESDEAGESDEEGRRRTCACAECACECTSGARGLGAVDATIRAHGLAVVFVLDARPVPFAYSVGMTETFNLPEFVMVANVSGRVVSTIATCIENLAKTSPDLLRGPGPVIADVLDGYQPDGEPRLFNLGWKPVPHERVLDPDSPAFMNMTGQRYPAGFEVRQAFLPDADGRLPWEPDCDPGWLANINQTDLSA